jgi:hypothetical protein
VATTIRPNRISSETLKPCARPWQERSMFRREFVIVHFDHGSSLVKGWKETVIDLSHKRTDSFKVRESDSTCLGLCAGEVTPDTNHR